MSKILGVIAGVAALSFASQAGAVTFVFKGDGGNVTPLGTLGADFVDDCATGGDFCSTPDHARGLNYSLGGVDLNVVAYAAGNATRLIQDRVPGDSGLGAFSEDNTSDDQTQFDSRESLEFDFGVVRTVTNVEFNAGGDRDCTIASAGSGEGVCGEFRLDIFDLSDALVSSTTVDITNTDVLPILGTGARFVLTALTPGGGFTVAQLSVNEVPVPAALPLLISGIAGLGFASRRRKQA
ncbi:MAG: VPLPA-CTERM sorting domain-containing protein [Pseudomonadota bacterium]